jgi:Zn-dependent protease
MELLVGILAFFLCIHGLLFGMLSSEGLLTSLFLTLICYLPHELAHMSQGGKYRLSPIMTVISLIASYFRLPFIAIGYVEFTTEENMLRKATAGIAMNILIAIAGLLLNFPIVVKPSIIFACSNAFPLYPLDGYIIFQKSKIGWVLMFTPLFLSVYLI